MSYLVLTPSEAFSGGVFFCGNGIALFSIALRAAQGPQGGFFDFLGGGYTRYPQRFRINSSGLQQRWIAHSTKSPKPLKFFMLGLLGQMS